MTGFPDWLVNLGETVYTDRDVVGEEDYEPRCAMCGAEWVRIPLGTLPPCWQRELNPEGRIYCPDCQQAILDREVAG